MGIVGFSFYKRDRTGTHNSWLGIGFGTTMTNTDMIAWFVTDGVGEVKDLYSTGYSSPEDDTS